MSEDYKPFEIVSVLQSGKIIEGSGSLKFKELTDGLRRIVATPVPPSQKCETMAA